MNYQLELVADLVMPLINLSLNLVWSCLKVTKIVYTHSDKKNGFCPE
ncbi:Uncharacterised protein [Legionella pneumophila]|nr:Uncharacterised protein [Legionella pneumophila]CZG14844.1 Uncharacterised protein [Legionella pneumophila]CZG14851.1 Uncharacterised protein [Legionella pneumophila]CZG15608.1 Uncharacterised protein [Legionella pneumophila]CZG15968.1 Uncharacterised protein [Legionella pneumophila]